MNLSTKEKEEKKYQLKLLELAKKISNIYGLTGSYFYEPLYRSKQHRFYVYVSIYFSYFFFPMIETESAKECYDLVIKEFKKRGKRL